MERNMALIGFGQLDTKQQIYFFDTTSAQGDLGWSSDQVMGSISCAGVNSRVNTRGLEKHRHEQVIFFKWFHLLTTRPVKVVGLLWANRQQFLLVRGKMY